MKQFCIIQDGIPKAMELLKPAFPLMRELALEETFLHVELSPGYDERLMFNRKYYLLKWKDGEHKLVGSTDFIEAIIEELTDQFNTRLAQAQRLKTKRPTKTGADIDPVDTLKNSDVEEKETDTWKALVSSYLQEQGAEPVVECLPALECAAPPCSNFDTKYTETILKGMETKFFPVRVNVVPHGKNRRAIVLSEAFTSRQTGNIERGTTLIYDIPHEVDINTLVSKINDHYGNLEGAKSVFTKPELKCHIYDIFWNGARDMRTLNKAVTLVLTETIEEFTPPEEVYPKEEEVEYQPIYVKVKEVGGIKFKSLEFNYPADKFCPPEEYNAEEFGTVVVARIRWQTDVKELVKELNENGCRSLSKIASDGRPPRRLNDEFARYAEMEYKRGYKVTLVLEEPTEEEQAILSELKTKADKAIDRVFGGK